MTAPSTPGAADRPAPTPVAAAGDPSPGGGHVPGFEALVARVSEQPPVTPAEEALLDGAERRRAAAFLRDEDRHRYQVAHLALRRELGARLGHDPATLAFYRETCPCCGEPHGRPAVVGGDGLHFSLSHAHDLVLLAFARVPVGADVERLVPLETVAATASVLHPSETAEIGALPEARRPHAFSRCWTRKEAYLKGTGSGLGEDPSVTYVGSGPEPGTVPGWRLVDLEVPAGYAAAVALSAG